MERLFTKQIGVVFFTTLLIALSIIMGVPGSRAEEQKAKATYVGSQKCKECHEEQYESYVKFSKKAHSFSSIKVMRKGLTEQEVKKCYECHTTGYGKPGGFRSESDTPHLKNAGCETCHGPGSLHVKSEAATDIKGSLTVKDCQHCHNQERVGSFRYRPLIYGGGH